MSSWKESFKVELDFSKGSAYGYKQDSKIPTKITFKRQHDGKMQWGKIKGDFTNAMLHNIMYQLKRGMTLEEINLYIKTWNNE